MLADGWLDLDRAKGDLADLKAGKHANQEGLIVRRMMEKKAEDRAKNGGEGSSQPGASNPSRPRLPPSPDAQGGEGVQPPPEGPRPPENPTGQVAPKAKPLPGTKEPWQMTKGEFVKRYSDADRNLVPAEATKLGQRKDVAKSSSVEDYKTKFATNHGNLPDALDAPIDSFTSQLRSRLKDPNASKYLSLVERLSQDGHLAGTNVTTTDTLTVPSTGQRHGGLYDPYGSTIYLSKSSAAHESMAARHLAHEAIHAALFRKIRDIESGVAADQRDVQTYGKLKGLLSRAAAEAQRQEKKFYGLSNVQEFVAEAATRPGFQKFLQGIKSESGGTVWGRFVDTVKSLFGIKDGTMLDEVLKASDDLLSSRVPIKPGPLISMRYETSLDRLKSQAEPTIEGEYNLLRSIPAEEPTHEEWLQERHRFHVEQALREGKTIPPEVLADYPDLSSRGLSRSNLLAYLQS